MFFTDSGGAGENSTGIVNYKKPDQSIIAGSASTHELLCSHYATNKPICDKIDPSKSIWKTEHGAWNSTLENYT